MARRAQRRGLRPIEVAEAAVLAGVSVALCLLGWLLPFGSVLIAAAVTPMALIALRNRPRAIMAGGVAAMTVSFLIAGTGLAANVAACTVLGTLLGAARRRGWGMTRTLAAAVVVVWPPLALVTVGILSVFANLRRLTLDQVRNMWTGAAGLLRNAGLIRLTRVGDAAVLWALGHWQVTVLAGVLAGLVVFTWVSRIVAWPILTRLSVVLQELPPAVDAEDPSAPVGPVPVELRDVVYQYPGALNPALRGVSLTVERAGLVAIVGPNGSGKSTLVRVLGGRPPTSGQILRPGGAGPGRPGGTALIFQRPDSQVLGIRVRDDVVWGLPSHHHTDVSALLARVGLTGMADRDTNTLSGGELQRLAVAAALARGPRLLISDEATAMVDVGGRGLLTRLFASLARDEGMAVVHVTHRPEETASADKALTLVDGRMIPGPPAPVPAPAVRAAARRVAKTGPPLLELRAVGHVYSAGSPWAHRALSGVDLALAAGDGVLVVGANGSGKSTLAWIVAGLLVPTEGATTLDGISVDRCVGRVALSFQHARLQLLRTTALSDVKAASGVDDGGAAAALGLVGLDPGAVGRRRVDHLSGGQQRRVALAGMLARQPRVLILDEPFAGLDAAGRTGLIDVLAALRDARGLTLLIISHDLEFADQLVDRVVTLEAGRIVDGGALEIPAGSDAL